MKTFKLLLLFVLTLLFCQPFPAQSNKQVKGKVVGVVDGDTITVLLPDSSQRLIHLVGIDAPEKEQDFGSQCRENLDGVLMNKTITVQVIKTSNEGFIKGKVVFKDQDISRSQLRTGCAWYDSSLTDTDDQSDIETYTEAEKTARQSKVGLWQNPAPIPPSDFRRQREALAAQERALINAPQARIFLKTPEGTESNAAGEGYSGSSTDSSGKTVHVRAYTRQDGTHVNSYNRSPPSSSGGGRRH